ncbi:TolC family protein [Sinimarinibacterium flocculans]|uniref:TolC family protein n=1 Tax=Sinimarinibacterium flocculans TaxID=985250 RepID=UPI002493CEBC|nr:TolC family protein [Sinimarinibacterium flocculans]
MFFRLIAAGRLAPVVLLAVAFSDPSVASGASLKLRDALARTLESNPDLAAYEYVLRAQDGRITQAGLRPNPVITADVENAFGTGETRGLDATELTIGLSQLIELDGLRDKRVTSAQFTREGLEIDGQIRRLDILAETARRFVKLVGQQEQHRLTHLAVELSEKTAEAVQRRVAAAISPESERDRAAVALERARIADAHAEHALVAARYELAASWGAIQPDFVEAAADLYALPELSAYEDLLAALERTPDLSRYLSERRLRESEVTLALASQRPGIEIGAGIRRLAEIDDTAFVFNVGIPLTVNNRNQGAVAEAEALKAGAQANRSAALLKARTQLFSNHRELQDLGQQVRALRERALPRTEAALKGTESAYERGRYSYLELVDAQRELLSVRDNLIEAAMQYHLTLIEIERLTATAVSR